MNKVQRFIKASLSQTLFKLEGIPFQVRTRNIARDQLALKEAERKLFSYCGIDKYQQYFVDAGDHSINTIQLGQGPPLVVLHGFAGGVGFWSRNLKELSKNYTVYAIDIPGFGRNVRAPYNGTTTKEAEDYFVSAIENWRQEMGLEKFHLLGHSLGGYISSCYTEKYPEYIQQLILADPFGVEETRIHPTVSFLDKLKMKIIILFSTYSLSYLRAAGPILGPQLVECVRWDLMEKWDDSLNQHYGYDPETDWYSRISLKDLDRMEAAEKGIKSRLRAHPLAEYIYLLNSSRDNGGELAFQSIVFPKDGKVHPLSSRLIELPKRIPISFVYGKYSWVRRRGAYQVKKVRRNVKIEVLKRSGHHLYIDDEEDFNDFVSKHSHRF